MSDFSYAHVPWRENMMGVQIPTCKLKPEGSLCECGCEQPLPAGAKNHRRYVSDRHEKVAKRRERECLAMVRELVREVRSGGHAQWLHGGLGEVVSRQEANGIETLLKAWAVGRKP